MSLSGRNTLKFLNHRRLGWLHALFWAALIGLGMSPSSGGVPWAALAASVLGLIAGWKVTQHGLADPLLRYRANESTIPALAACAALLISACLLILDREHRLTAAMMEDGKARHYLGSAVLALACPAIALRLWGKPRNSAVSPLLLLPTLTIALASFLIWQGIGRPIAAIESAIAILLASDVLFSQKLLDRQLDRTLLSIREQGAEVSCKSGIDILRSLRSVYTRRRGILTSGTLSLRECICVSDGSDREEVLRLAGAAEFGARHPIRDALMETEGIRSGTIPGVKGFEHLPNRGVRAFYRGKELLCCNRRMLEELDWAQPELTRLDSIARPLFERGNTVLFVCFAQEVLGIIAFEDKLRPEATEALRHLDAAGVKVHLISRDDPRSVAAQLGSHQTLTIHEGQESGDLPGLVSETARRGATSLLASKPLVEEREAFDMWIQWPLDPSPRSQRNLDPKRLRLTRPDLSALPRAMETARRYAWKRRGLLGILSLGQIAFWGLASGALYPLIGVGPSPLLGAAVYLLTRFQLRHRESQSSVAPAAEVL